MKPLLLFLLVLSCGGNEDDFTESSPPEDLDELHDWLTSGQYRDWTRENAITIGDNGAPRRLFANETLLTGLESQNSFKKGAVSVREMYEKNQIQLRGISLMQKREVDGQLKWFYYETFSLEERNHSVAQFEAPGCEFCHKEGRDFIQSSISYFEN